MGRAACVRVRWIWAHDGLCKPDSCTIHVYKLFNMRPSVLICTHMFKCLGSAFFNNFFTFFPFPLSLSLYFVLITFAHANCHVVLSVLILGAGSAPTAAGESWASTLRTVPPECWRVKTKSARCLPVEGCMFTGWPVHVFIRDARLFFFFFYLYLRLDYRYQERKRLNEFYLL